MLNANQAIAHFTDEQAKKIVDRSNGSFEKAVKEGRTFSNPSWFLLHMFSWMGSPEGYAYWQSVGASADLEFRMNQLL